MELINKAGETATITKVDHKESMYGPTIYIQVTPDGRPKDSQTYAFREEEGAWLYQGSTANRVVGKDCDWSWFFTGEEAVKILTPLCKREPGYKWDRYNVREKITQANGDTFYVAVAEDFKTEAKANEWMTRRHARHGGEYDVFHVLEEVVATIGGKVDKVVKATWYPAMPPMLDGESLEGYTDRLTGADGTGRVPYDHRRNRQCSIGYHKECSDPQGLSCECPCHKEGE